MDIITEMTTAQMVAEYNQLTGKSIKKFSDRKAGERQLASAREMAAIKKLLSGVAKPAGDQKRKPKEPKVKAKQADSARAARSWKMASMTVDGVVYRSIKAAFDSLGLPLNKHGKFRLKLKSSGEEIFEHEGKQYHFVLVND